MISIILNRYSLNKQNTHMDMCCLAQIVKFTDGPYEVIVVDNSPEGVPPIRNEYGVLDYRVIENKENQNVYHSYHQGALEAKGDILAFIQNDVYVHERTINKLATYLNDFDMAFPQQIPISREDVLKVYALSDGEIAEIGQRDAGLIVVKKDAYFKSGGWDDRFHNLLGEAALFTRWDQSGLSWVDRTNAFITHIMAGSNLLKEEGTYNEEMAHDAKLLEEYR